MFTQCSNPACRGAYSITAQHLRLAMGMVRCPRCRTVFNALSSIHQPTPEEADEVELITRQLPYAQRGDRIVLSHAAASKQRWYKKLQQTRREAAETGVAAADPDTVEPQDAAPRAMREDRSREEVVPAVPMDGMEEAEPGQDAPHAPLRSTLLASAGDLGLALRNVVRQSRRSALGMAAIVFGVVAILLAGGFIEWSLWALRESTILSRLGHIQVVKPGYLELGLSDPFAYLLPERSPVLDSLEKQPSVRVVAPRLGFTGLIAFGDISVSFVGEGVDAERERVASSSLELVKGAGLSPDAPNGIIVGKGLAANLDVEPGDVVVLLGTTESGTMSAVEAEIRGLFRTPSKAYDDTVLRVPLDMARSLLQVSGAHRWVVLLDRTENTDRVLADLQSRFPVEQAKVQFVPWIDLADFYRKSARLLSAQMDIVRVAIAIIIVVSISNTLAMSVIERTAEIGTLLALGLRRNRILKLFLNEGVVLGITGGLTGVALGLGLAAAISTVGIPMPPPPGADFGFLGRIMVTWQLALGALVLAIAATLIASVYPAWKAASLEIVDALRHAR